MDYRVLKEKLLADEEIRNEYDSLEPEYQLVAEIIRCREEQNMSQQALADVTGINRTDISRLENGNSNPSLKTMKRVAEGLGRKLRISFV